MIATGRLRLVRDAQVLRNSRPRSARDRVPVCGVTFENGLQHSDFNDQLVRNQYSGKRSKQPHFTYEGSG